MRKGVWALSVVSIILVAPMFILPSWNGGNQDAIAIHRDPMPMSGERSPPPVGLEIDLDVGPCFTENLGQLEDGRIGLYAEGERVSIGFGPGRVTYLVRDQVGGSLSMFRTHFPGCRPVEPEGIGLEGHPTSYFRGTEEDWVVGARSYRQVHFRGLYEGIDLVYYFRDGSLKYDLVVAPGCDPTGFRLSYEGLEGLELDSATGDLLIRTASGTLREDAPKAYQELPTGRSKVACDFDLGGDMTVAFDTGHHDDTYPLIIDPGFVFSTYLGGSSIDYADDMVVDSDGHIYVTGATYSSNFPMKAGSYDTVDNAGEDAYVVKLAKDGKSLKYATYLGGSGQDWARAICVDSSGCAFVTGAGTDGFPTTSGASDTTANGMEAFATKFNAGGTDLVFSTFIGGSYAEEGYAIDIDGSGNVYIHGETTSNDFPVSTGAFDKSYGGNDRDAFFVKLNASGDSLQYATYLGGNDYDLARDIHVAGPDLVYLLGTTFSSDFPVTSGVFKTRNTFDTADVYVSKFNVSTGSFVFSTYVGGFTDDHAARMHVDPQGYVYCVAGADTGFPTTYGAYKTLPSRWSNAVVFKLKPDGSDLVYGTYLGGYTTDKGFDIGVDDEGAAYVCGHTDSQDFPTTEGAYCTTLNGWDAWLAKFSANGSELLYSTFIGGSSADSARAMCMGNDGFVYLFGTTRSTDFPTSQGAFDTSHDQQDDAFVLKADLERPDVFGGVMDPFATTGDPFNLSINATDNWGVERIEVEYWHGMPPPHNVTSHEWVNMTLVAGTPANGTWNVSFNAWNNSVQTLHTALHVYDHAGNEMPVRYSATVVYDNDAPSIEDLTTGHATTGDGFMVGVDVTDNIAVAGVLVEYWFKGGAAGAVRTNMTPQSISGLGNGTYICNISIPATPLLPLQYMFFVNDTSDNQNRSETIRTVVVVDDDGPLLTVLDLPENVTTGEWLTVDVTVRDNIGVEEVWVEAWHGQERGQMWMNATMVPVGTDEWGNGSYSGTVQVREDTLLMLNLVFWASDPGGNQASSPRYTLDVIDDDRPFIYRDDTPDVATTGDPLDITISVTDNIEVDSVWVQYWYGRGIAENASLVRVADIWTVTVQVRHIDLGLHYVIYAEDTSGNLNWTEQRELGVLDNDPPEILADPTSAVATTGDPHLFTVSVRDNLGTASATVQFRFGEGEPRSLGMTGDVQGGTGVWTFTLGIDIPPDSLLPLRYRFEATDPSGNANTTNERSVEVLDDDPPELEHDNGELLVPKGQDCELHVTVRDNIGVGGVTIIYRLGEGAEVRLPMERTPSDGDMHCEVMIPIPRRVEGPLHYRFEAEDASGNTNATEWFEGTCVNRPPELKGDPPIWYVTEEATATLDLLDHVVDGNDPATALTAACDAPGIIVSGLVLQTRYDEWEPEHRLEVSVTDGEDTLWFNVTVRVTDVNDAPVIVSVTPGSGSTYEKGESIRFVAEATDEDGDDLTYTWRDGDEVIGEGAELDHDRLPEGERTVTLEVSDGTASASSSITVVIEQKEEPLPSLAVWLLVLVVLVVAGTVTYLMIRRRGEA